MFHSAPGGMSESGAAHFKEPFLHKSIHVWKRVRTCLSRPARANPERNGLNGTAWLNQALGTLKLPNLGPPPTCPFILTNDVKERKTDALANPLFLGAAGAPGSL